MSVARSRSRLCPRPLLLSLAVCFAASVSVPIVATAIPSDAQAAPAYVDPALTDRLDRGGKANMLVYLERRADLSAAFGMNWKDRGHYVQQQLQAVADDSQRELRALLDQQGVEYQAFWIDNVVFVRDADRRLLDALASRSASLAIAKFVDEPEVHLIEPESVAEARLPTLATASTAISNIDHVRAPAVWDLGFTGRGITVANIDTGVRHTHEAIVNGYRGTTGPGQYDHNYNWWSPYAVTTAPVDPHNHGSHTIGTMVGNGGPDRHIGMAPGAQWMACQGFTPSSTGAGLLECGQFLLAPWNLNRQNPDPNRRPHVINNSWSDCGRSVDPWYEGVIDSWIAAGIVPVFSNGNASNCSYTRPPGLNTIGNPARYGKSFSIGSTGNDNGLYAAHSNWGPTDYPTTGLPNYPDPRGYPNIKPNVVAPGVSVLSAGKDSTDHYYLSTGTSMSAPHVAGLVALMWEAAPCLVGDYARTGTIIMQTARPVPYATGGTPAPGPGNVPNYATGWGEIDALGAVEAAMQLCGGFTIASEPQALRVCAAAPASYGLKLQRHGAFADAVTLSVNAGLPAGATATFSPNPVAPAVPAAASTLTIGGTAGQPTASHRLTIKAQFGALARSTSVDLHIDGAPLAAPGLDTPTAAETNVVGRPNFTWSGVAGESYRIQVAANPAFTAPVVDQSVVATSFRPTMPLATGTTYYWRVHGENTCGNGAWSAVGQFTTRFDPRASITPGSLAFTQTPGTTGTRTLDVANTGSANLVWTANEANVAGVATPAADAAWQPIGPLGGDVSTIVVSPLDPDVVLAGTSPGVGEGNLYRSADGGATWTVVEANVSVYRITFASDSTIYAATKTGVRKSTDDGLTWTTPNLNIGTNRQTYGVSTAPSNASIVWAGVAAANGQQTKNLLRSTNAGATWTNVTPAIGAGLNGRAIAVHPTDTNTVVALFDGAFGGGQVWVSTNGGTNWTNRSAGLPANPLRSVHYDGTRLLVGGGQAYNSQNFGIYQSLDLGVTWTALHTQTPPPRVESIAVDPQNRNTIWLATSDTGIHRSTDGGATWATNLGGTTGIGMMDVALVPGDASKVFAGALSHGLFRSIDSGGSFAKYGTGISEIRLHSIAINPLDAQDVAVAFQSANAGGIYSSADGGATWMLEPAPATRYITVRFAPDGTLYGVSVGPTTIAREALYRRNGDGTWTNIGPNQGANFLVDLQALVFSRNDPDLILAGGKDNGVAGQEGTIWRSADRGQTWTKVFESGVNYKVTSIEIIEDGTDLNMIATHGSASLGNVLRSIDGGLTWQNSSTGLDTTGYWMLAQTCVHPATPQRVFLVKGNPSTLYRSDDGGENWQTVGTAFTRLVSALACDPIDENVIYVGQGSTLAGTVRVLRSTDAGATFSNFDAGIPMAGPQPSAFAFQGSSSLLVSTQGGGAYRTSLGGEARACMNPQDVPWLGLTPSGGTTAPGSSTAVTVTANAGTLAFGQYRAQLCFDTNDPNAELIRVPVQLTVANAAQGTLAGKVDAIGQCGVGTSVAGGAQVTITGQHSTFNVTTDANGRYSQTIDLAEGPLAVLVRKTGYVDETRSGITLVSTQVTNVDVAVERDAPCLDATPTGFDVALAAGTTATRTLTLDNADGAGTLTWSATDATPQGAPPAPTVLAPAAAPGRAATAGSFDLADYLGAPLPGVTTTDALGGINCTAGSGLIRHDDGSVESGFGADPSLVQRIMMVDYFVPATYPAKLDAACFVFVSLGPTSLDFDLVVYDDDGPGGSPGTELGTLPYTATDLPLPPLPVVLPWKGFDLSSLNLRIASGGVYIGVRWFATDPPVTMGADTSAASPASGGGYRKFDNTPWDLLVNAWPQYRSLFIRAVTRDVSGCSAPSDVPWLTLAPASGSVAPRGSADVTVQIDSSGLAAGEHHASLCVTSNDPARPRVIVPVKLTVGAGPNEPGTLNVLGGSGQSASVGTAFAAPLAVQVLNGSGQPLAGVNVDFAAPATGASATLSHARVTTDANGYATVQAVANANAGSYAVTATVGSLAAAQFALTNLAASIDLAVDVHSVRGHVRRGDIADYLVTVRNVGGDTATGASVSGQLSAQLDAPFAGWVCLGPATSACRETGTGNLADTGLTMPRGGSVSYLVSAPVRWDAEGVAAIAGRSTHASDTNPANNDSTDGATVVIHRDGFESRAQAALRRIDETLDAGTAIAFALTAPADGVVDTLLAAVPRGANLGVDAAAFRVERLNDGDATRLRLVARDAEGQAYASAWIRASTTAEASITFVAVDTGSVNGDTPAQGRIELHTDAGVVAIPLGGRADGFDVWSAVPARGVTHSH